MKPSTGLEPVTPSLPSSSGVTVGSRNVREVREMLDNSDRMVSAGQDDWTQIGPSYGLPCRTLRDRSFGPFGPIRRA